MLCNKITFSLFSTCIISKLNKKSGNPTILVSIEKKHMAIKALVTNCFPRGATLGNSYQPGSCINNFRDLILPDCILVGFERVFFTPAILIDIRANQQSLPFFEKRISKEDSCSS